MERCLAPSDHQELEPCVGFLGQSMLCNCVVSNCDRVSTSQICTGLYCVIECTNTVLWRHSTSGVPWVCELSPGPRTPAANHSACMLDTRHCHHPLTACCIYASYVAKWPGLAQWPGKVTWPGRHFQGHSEPREVGIGLSCIQGYLCITCDQERKQESLEQATTSLHSTLHAGSQ